MGHDAVPADQFATIDRESESELRDLYGEVGYTIIDDVLTLPERLPGIYRRLTT